MELLLSSARSSPAVLFSWLRFLRSKKHHCCLKMKDVELALLGDWCWCIAGIWCLLRSWTFLLPYFCGQYVIYLVSHVDRQTKMHVIQIHQYFKIRKKHIMLQVVPNGPLSRSTKIGCPSPVIWMPHFGNFGYPSHYIIYRHIPSTGLRSSYVDHKLLIVCCVLTFFFSLSLSLLKKISW